MSDDLKYVIKMVNAIAIAFIALVSSILGLVGVAIVEDAAWLAVFSVLVLVFFGGCVVGTASLVCKIDLKRGNEDG